MDYLVMGAAACVIIALLAVLYIHKNKTKAASAKKVLIGVKCPVCRTELFKGENITTKVYRPRNVPDQLCDIFGCPHCFPQLEPGKTRECPVCHKTLSQKEHLTARLFNKATGKNHLHILGCPHCRSSEGKIN